MRYLAVSVALLLVFAITRYHNVDSMPVFFDEAESIRISKMAWTGPSNWLLGAHLNRLLYIWWVALFWPFTGALWISRAANLLAGFVGLAAIIRIGRMFGSIRAGWLAVGFYITMPIAFFFDRIVLGEHIQMAISAALILASGRLVLHRNQWAAIIAGLLLTAYWLTKGTGFFWLGTPLFLLVMVSAAAWRRQLRLVGVAYGVFAVSSLPFVVLLRYVRSDYGLGSELHVMGVENAISSGSGMVSDLTARLVAHSHDLWALATSSYLPGLLVPITVIGIALAVWRRSRISAALMLSVVVPMTVIMAALNRFEVRYLVPAIPAIVVTTALGWSALLEKLPRAAGWSASALLPSAILATGSFQFMYAGWVSPLQMPLSSVPNERDEYLIDWSAGTDMPAIAAIIQQAADRRPTDLVVTDEGQIIFISTYLGAEPHIRWLRDYDEPELRIKVLYEGLTSPFASLADPCRQVFLLAKSPQEDQRVADLTTPLKHIASFPRPHSNKSYELYRVYPTQGDRAVHAPGGCQ